MLNLIALLVRYKALNLIALLVRFKTLHCSCSSRHCRDIEHSIILPIFTYTTPKLQCHSERKKPWWVLLLYRHSFYSSMIAWTHTCTTPNFFWCQPALTMAISIPLAGSASRKSHGPALPASSRCRYSSYIDLQIFAIPRKKRYSERCSDIAYNAM